MKLGGQVIRIVATMYLISNYMPGTLYTLFHLILTDPRDHYTRVIHMETET